MSSAAGILGLRPPLDSRAECPGPTCVETVNVTASVWDFSESGFELAISPATIRLRIVSDKS
jgi:hypothetical protein